MGEESISEVSGGTTMQHQTSEATTVPAHTTAEPSVETGDFAIPEAYKDKPYLKDVTSLDDVFKKLDGAQGLIGKNKINFPDENTTDEDRLAFNIAAGMPEKAEDYTFDIPEGQERNEQFESRVKELFHESELSDKAATKLQVGFDALMKEMAASQGEVQDAAFAELSTKILGERVDEVLASGKTLLAENTPEGMEEAVQNLSNESLVIMGAVLDKIKSKYIDEDSINDNNLRKGGADGVDALREKGRALMKDPARADAFHPKHKEVNEKITEIYAEIGKLSM
jgi:hypothetical protein|tara:strand:+ start:7382 stop:8230 length:849 start_codon:yes stop_codon:yes gene_type:complete